MMFGWKTNPHAGPSHILSFVFIVGGFILISAACCVFYDAEQQRRQPDLMPMFGIPSTSASS
jgi:hypothetical protein